MYFKNIYMLFTSKVSLVSFVVALIWISTDVNERMLQGLQLSGNNSHVVEFERINLPHVKKQTVDEISQSYEINKVDSEEKAVKAVGMSTEQQKQQAGKLETVFVDNKKLQLKAILRNQNRIQLIRDNALNNESAKGLAKKNEAYASALIQVSNLDTHEVLIERFDNFTRIYGFNLTILNNTQVQLSKQNDGILQTIVLAMYLPTSQSSIVDK